MKSLPARLSHRRDFLKFLAASPLVTALPGRSNDIITSPKQALNVFDFEAAARQALPPAHFGYLATGVDSVTKVAVMFAHPGTAKSQSYTCGCVPSRVYQ